MLGNLLLAGVPNWVSNTFGILQAVFVGIMAVACIVIIIAILASTPQTGMGSNVITGASESYYTKHKGKNNQGRLKILIIVCASVAAVSAILYFVAFAIYPGA